MLSKRSAAVCYLSLALGGMFIPVFHHLLVPQIIENARYFGGLDPGEFVLFSSLDWLTYVLPVPAIVAFFLSSRFDFFRRFDGVFFLSICMLVCASVYAIYCLFLLYSDAILRSGWHSS
jgi:hypothetical protein